MDDQAVVDVKPGDVQPEPEIPKHEVLLQQDRVSAHVETLFPDDSNDPSTTKESTSEAGIDAPAKPDADSLAKIDFSTIDESLAGTKSEETPEIEETDVTKMDEDQAAKYVEADEAVSVDVKDLKEGPKKSIYKLISQRDEQRSKNKELKAQVKELNTALSSRPTQEKITELEQQSEELKKRLGFHEVSETPEFKSRISDPRDEIMEIIKDVGRQYVIPPEDVSLAVSMTIKNRTEFLKEKYPDYASAIAPSLLVLDRLTVAEKGLREKHPEVLSQYKVTQEQERIRQIDDSKKNQQANLNNMLDQSIRSAQQARIPYFVKNGDESHDGIVDGVLSKSKEVLLGNDPQAILGYAVIGASVPAYHEGLTKANARVAELEAKLAKMQQSAPGVKGKAASPTKSDKDQGRLTAQEFVNNMLNS